MYIYIYICTYRKSFVFFLHFSAWIFIFYLPLPGSLRQLYLGVLWLYTRESWLPHVLDAVAGVRRALDGDEVGLLELFPMEKGAV